MAKSLGEKRPHSKRRENEAVQRPRGSRESLRSNRGEIIGVAVAKATPLLPRPVPFGLFPLGLGRKTPRVVIALASGVVCAAAQPSTQSRLIHRLDLHSGEKLVPSLRRREEPAAGLLQSMRHGLRRQAFGALVALQHALCCPASDMA